MKIYCIKLDAMPFNNEVLLLQKKVKGYLQRQVAGLFTINACIQLFTGKVTCSLTPKGIGYHNWMDSKRDNGRVNFDWEKEFIQFYLEEKKFNFISRNVLGLYLVYGLDKYNFLMKDSSTVMDRFDKNKWVLPTRWSSEIAQSILIGTGEKAAQAINDEIEYVKKIQSRKVKGNEFYFISYNHYHIACQWGANSPAQLKNAQKRAWKNAFDVLKCWDFEEEDALFWFFSDHGAWFHPSITANPLPDHYFVWNIVKDNTGSKIKPPQVMSIQDFPKAIKNIVENKKVFEPYSKDRIFLTEDGRAAIDATRMTTAIACQVDLEQRQLRHTSYHLGNKKFVHKRTFLDDKGFILKTENGKRWLWQEEELKNNFDWVV